MASEDNRPPLPSAVTLPAGSGATDPSPAKAAAAALVLGALGVVFGDIGTSPLYTLRETFAQGSGMTPTPRHVLGVLSILFWAVTLTVTVKDVTLIMRADNKGEGGVLALATLATQGLNGRGRNIRRWITLFAVVGLALFYGDAMITPAISVLSAVEGLMIVEPGLAPLVVPIAIVILTGLFFAQSRGTAKIGALFGPLSPEEDSGRAAD
jgi:KUP system potassium uptake protein